MFSSSDLLKDQQIPEWAQQELSHCSKMAGMVESWFPQSDQSGVSSHLMESMRYEISDSITWHYEI